MYQELGDILQQLGYFDTIYTVRVFSYMLYSPAVLSGKEISDALKISDSKVYPALKMLVDLGLVQKNEQERPHQYYLIPPDKIVDYITTRYNEERNQRKELLDACIDLIYDGWNERTKGRSRTGKIYTAAAIPAEILNLQAQPLEEVMILLGSASLPYLDSILSVLKSLLNRQIPVKLALPHSQTFVDGLNKLDHKNPSYSSYLEIKQSKLKRESYILSNKNMLFTMSHLAIGDIAYYTDVAEFTRVAYSNWANEEYCIHFHRIL